MNYLFFVHFFERCKFIKTLQKTFLLFFGFLIVLFFFWFQSSLLPSSRLIFFKANKIVQFAFFLNPKGSEVLIEDQSFVSKFRHCNALALNTFCY